MLDAIRAMWLRHDVKLVGILSVAGLLFLLLNPEAGSESATVANPNQRKPLSNLTFRGLNGDPWNLVDQRGKVVLINVWASWCPPCRQETPGLVAIANEYRGKPFELVGASMDDSTEPVKRFIDEFRVPYTIVVPSENSPINHVDALPTSFLIDRDGRVARVYIGAISERTLRLDINRLLTES
jgi:thiol-disulfide isomerase/thioredoxin